VRFDIEKSCAEKDKPIGLIIANKIMNQRITLFLAFTFIVQLSYSQIVDRYGISIGTSYSTQNWEYKHFSADYSNDYKIGFMTFIHAEQNFGNILALRTEIGYIQKGFKNQMELTFPDGTSAGVNNDNVVLHDLALNLGLKVKPLKIDYSPYLLVGIRCDYMIAYKDIVFEEQASGQKFNMYESTIEDFDKFNLGGLVGLGVAIKELLYLEIEYNPNLTKNLDNAGLRIIDNCWGVKLGVNVN